MEKPKRAEIVRFLIGLGIVSYAFAMFIHVLILKNALNMFVYAFIGTPWGLIALFSLIPGTYFMLVSKPRWQLDVIMGILGVISIVLSSTLKAG
ncbi:hypothetical protein [Tepidanaerobacter syntrophicus]|uniref:hypothetical protein n=1 Tax=Tepidanaerobacter syntrophicus TaxID=224999 RepID=UPI001BD2BBA7|nr:hypothetical protein [Tepidanaerobacter syntrophicus]